ncbi:MAG TPA: hypothetical protein VMU60_12805 [Syntrophobacteria bacterium]|nr:hypothetical protein [Syntrophobacteria bacterium]
MTTAEECWRGYRSESHLHEEATILIEEQRWKYNGHPAEKFRRTWTASSGDVLLVSVSEHTEPSVREPPSVTFNADVAGRWGW